MSSLRPRDRIALVALIAVAIVAGYYLLLLKPERHQATSLSAQVATARTNLVAEQQAYAVGRAARTALAARTAQWASLRLAVPQQSDIPALLRTLQKTAGSVHVKMQAITLSGASATGATATTPTSTAGSSATGAAAAGATTIPLQLSFEGGYAALDKLVKKLDGLVVVSGSTVHATGPLLSIGNVSLTGGSSLTVQLTASIYQLGAAPTSPTTGQ